MSMPKGMKHDQGYATVDGPGYREIAERMTADGHKMNHATARNYFIRAMTKLAKPIVQQHDVDMTASQVAQDPRFQSAIASMIREVVDDVDF
jgi:hypothetical protein